jgi:acetolactate synthase-1/2/3 large subunit
VFAVVPGPGVLNAMTGLATAYSTSSPVLAIAANLPAWAIDGGLGLLHEISAQEDVLRSATKAVLPVRDNDDLAAAVRDALAATRDGRSQPVAVSIPENLLKEAGGATVPTPPQRLVRPDQDTVAKAAQLLANAERPVVLAGGGVVAAGASEALGALATKLRTPVVTTANGRGALSDRHPWTLTSLGGREVLPDADVVLIVGSRGLRMDGTPLVGDTTTILLNADETDLGAPHKPAVALHSDARLGLTALTGEISAVRSQWTTEDIDAIRTRCATAITELGEITDWVHALRAGMADDDVLVGELTQVGYLSRVAFPVYAPRTFLSPATRAHSATACRRPSAHRSAARTCGSCRSPATAASPTAWRSCSPPWPTTSPPPSSCSTTGRSATCCARRSSSSTAARSAPACTTRTSPTSAACSGWTVPRQRRRTS